MYFFISYEYFKYYECLSIYCLVAKSIKYILFNIYTQADEHRNN